MLFRVRPDVDQVVSVVCDEGADDYADDEWRTDIAEKKRIAALILESIGGGGGEGPTVDALASRMCSTTTSMILRRHYGKKRRVISVDALTKSELTRTLYKGRYFIYLMSHSVISKTDSHVGYTTNPLVDLFCHNNHLFVDRNTCMAAPHWMLDIVLGPFPSKEQAIECGRIWVDRTRGKESKRDKAEFLAETHNVDMYSFSEVGREPVKALLERFASCEFVGLYDDMSREYGLVDQVAER